MPLEMKLGVSQQMQQSMKLSPQMIQTVSLLAMPATELRDRIYAEVEKNPALEIIKDSSEISGDEFGKSWKENNDYGNKKVFQLPGEGHLRKTNAGGNEESDNFQTFLENRPGHNETLQEHLLSQLHLMTIAEAEMRLSEKIIANLDEHGFHHVSPESLLDAAFPEETPELLDKCLQIIRSLDPVGTACYGIQESLVVQAKLLGNAPPLAILILSHHFNLLDNPRPQILYKKLSAFPPVMLQNLEISLKKVEEAIDFIKTLDPLPARQFGSSIPVFVAPDVIVRKIPREEADDENHDSQFKYKFQIEIPDNLLPDVIISPVFERLADKNQKSDLLIKKSNNIESNKMGMQEGEKKFVDDSVKDAKWFLDAINLRKATLLKVVKVILRRQAAFFDMGPRYLSPLRMKEVADEIGVHETTVSRVANSKYLRCEWGFFEIKYFFSNASGGLNAKIDLTVKSDNNDITNADIKKNTGHIPMTSDGTPLVAGGSKESVKHELRLIIEENEKNNPGKKISDEKLSKLLAERGINIARRTVAKYRTELNISSSYLR